MRSVSLLLIRIILFRLQGGHPDGAVQTKSRAVDHDIGNDVCDELSKLLATSEALREWWLLLKGLADLWWHIGHHGSIKNAWCNGDTSDAKGSEFASNREGHSNNGTL
eukprot:GEZU01037944.1.p1 GENE.GEZU01037944.1~~GEZU01037944.1.p1  ORF type:complete len:108 (-),score=7.26 GEZU01037944.1:1-324(-)